MSSINTCNYTINGEGYYSQTGGEVASAVLGVVFEGFMLYIWSALTILFLLIWAFSQSTTVLIMAIIFALLAGWDFYTMKQDLAIIANAEQSSKTAPNSRPCKDATTGVVYN